jgi:hypothetical protein
MIIEANQNDYRKMCIPSREREGILHSFVRSIDSIVNLDTLLKESRLLIMENLKPDETVITVSQNGNYLVATNKGISKIPQNIIKGSFLFDGQSKKIPSNMFTEDSFLKALGLRALEGLNFPLLEGNDNKQQIGTLIVTYNTKRDIWDEEMLIKTISKMISWRVKIFIFQPDDMSYNLTEIKNKTDWIVGIIKEAIDNFDDEAERLISLLQTKRMLRNQVWELCTGTLEQHRRAITHIINAINRANAKDITIDELISLKTAVMSLKEDIDSVKVGQIEDAMLLFGRQAMEEKYHG